MINRIVSWVKDKINPSEQNAMKTAFEKQDWQTFLELSNRQLEKTPNDQSALANAALAHINLHQPEKAIEKINAALKLEGDTGYCHYIRATANNALCKSADAVEDCTKAIELGQTHPGSYLIRMLANTQQYKYEDALKDIDHVIKHCPTLKTAKVHKAHALHSMNKNTDALDLCNEVIDSVSGDELVFTLAIRAFAYNRLGKLDLAIADMTKALELGNDKGSLYLDLADLYAHKGDLEKMQECIQLATPKTKREDAIKSLQNAKLNLLKKDNGTALRFSEEAVGKLPQDASMRAVHGLSLLRLGLNEDALRELNTAADLDPYCIDARWFRAELNEKLGNKVEAEKDKAIASEHGYVPYL
jgi:tetratricopeptide (TPR) repeat protein